MKEMEEEKVAKAELPKIGIRLHAPIDSMAAASSNLRMRAEGTYPDVKSAELALIVSRNLGMLVPEGSESLSARFAKMLAEA